MNGEKMLNIPIPERIQKFAIRIQEAGGTTYLAGGCVRDHLLEQTSKDIDLEIHGITEDELAGIIQTFPPSKAVGKSFGIWKLLATGTEMEIDVALPNIDGISAPFIGVEEACKRRDLTINAMLVNVITGELIDPFHGRTDLEHRRLVASDPLCFSQDPLRVFRACQFSARLNCNITPALVELCQTLTAEESFSKLPSSRVFTELEKAWIKSSEPSIAFSAMWDLGAIPSYFPSLPSLTEHVWSQFLTALRYAKVYRLPDMPGRNMGLLWSLLTFSLSSDEKQSLLDHFDLQQYMGFPIRSVILLLPDVIPLIIREHCTIVQNLVREQFDLCFVADVAKSLYPERASVVDQNLNSAKQRGVLEAPLPKLVHGAEVMALGLQGPMIGEALQRLRTEQLHERVQTHQEALQWLKSNYPQKDVL